MTIEDFFIPLMAGVGGGFIGAFLVRTKKPDWIKDVVKAETDTQWALLHQHIENLQAKGIEQIAKLRQAQSIIRQLTDDWGGAKEPVASQDEIARVLDYFIDGDRFDPNFLPWPRQ